MQVKVVIGTIAFMLTMIVLGYAALLEPSRLENFTGAAQGRSIEQGAQIYINNCATCHGPEGTAEQCVDAAGDSIPCVGRKLNYYFLLCGDRPERLEEARWQGTKAQFIETTVSAGRTGTVMPAWLNEFGGPMRPDQVQNVTNFVLNWETEELCANPPPEFPWPETVEEYNTAEFDEIEPPFQAEPGDPERGAAVYEARACFSCHGYPEEPGSNTVGPWLGEIADVGGTRVAGTSAQQYVYNSILHPNDFIAPDCPTGPCADPSAMPSSFASDFAQNPQDMADILAYLLGDAYEFP
jgi:mono/diheme cytochrome c family protein